MTTRPLRRPQRPVADEPGRSTQQDATPARRLPTWLVPAPPALLALVLGLWHLTTPGIWRDEAASLAAAQRTLPQLWALTGNLDAVHGCYYLLLHVEFAVTGPSVLALRLPSVIAGVGTAALLTAVAARIGNRRAALFAGLYWAVLPEISRYLQEGRSYSLVSLCVTAAAWFLMRRQWVRYALALAVALALNLLAGLSLAAFAVTLLVWRRQGAADGRTLLRAALATGSALLVGAGPVVWRAHSESSVLNWIPSPGFRDVDALTQNLSGSDAMVYPMLLLLVYGAWYGFRHRERALAALALPLAVVPPLLLLTASWLDRPMYVERYVLYSFVGTAWLVGLGLDAAVRRLPRFAGLALGLAFVVLTASLGFGAQQHIRGLDGHGDPLRRLAQVIRDNALPGDAVVFLTDDRRYAEVAYPSYFHNTEDALLAGDPAELGRLYGANVPDDRIGNRLKTYTRVWVIWGRLNESTVLPAQGSLTAIRNEGFRLEERWQVTLRQDVILYVRKWPSPELYPRKLRPGKVDRKRVSAS